MSKNYSIGFDARMINHSGIGRYIRGLLYSFIKIAPPDIQIHLLGNTEELKDFNKVPITKIHSFEMPVYGPREQFQKSYWESFQFDLLHIPHYNVPLLVKIPVLTTIHDLIHFQYPSTVSSYPGRFYARYLMRKGIHKSKHIITDSNSVKDEIIQTFGVPSQRIDTIYPGLHDLSQDLPDKTQNSQILKDLGVNKPYLLSIGINKIHKNFSRLCRAFLEINQDNNHTLQLVIVSSSKFSEDITGPNIVVLKNLSDSQLATLYSHAQIYVLLSLAEGFSFTPLEALGFKTKVLVSDIPVHREILGNNVLYCNPLNIQDIKTSISSLLNGKSGLSDSFIPEENMIMNYTWNRAARKTLEIYYNLMNGK